MTARNAIPLLLIVALLAGCRDAAPPPTTETIAVGDLALSVRGSGELRSAKPTPLNVPGANWDSRRVEWMLPEGSVVRKDDVIARFAADEGKQQLAQAVLDLQRNALARAAKDGELDAARGRVDVDLSDVAVQLAIAQRYARADLGVLARNDVLDAVQDVHYLDARRDTLQWQRSQAGRRGSAELAVLDAQRSTYAMSERSRQADLDALELRAPNDGVVMLSPNWSGDKPMLGTSMYAGSEYGSLPDLSAMEVEIAVPQIEAQGVRVGNAVRLSPSGRPQQAFTSRLSWVASAAKVRSRQNATKVLSMRAPVPADVVRRFALVPGQQIDARVVLLDARKAIGVANVAIRNDSGATFVRVRDGDRFVRRNVRIGVRGAARSQVLSGLAAGDEVLLADGATVAAAAGDAGTAPDDAEPGAHPGSKPSNGNAGGAP